MLKHILLSAIAFSVVASASFSMDESGEKELNKRVNHSVREKVAEDAAIDAQQKRYDEHYATKASIEEDDAAMAARLQDLLIEADERDQTLARELAREEIQHVVAEEGYERLLGQALTETEIKEAFAAEEFFNNKSKSN